jgi:hypothetical protein
MHERYGEEPNHFDEAELRLQMRQMYHEVGYRGAIRCLYEILFSANVLIDVILEEVNNDK